MTGRMILDNIDFVHAFHCLHRACRGHKAGNTSPIVLPPTDSIEEFKWLFGSSATSMNFSGYRQPKLVISNCYLEVFMQGKFDEAGKRHSLRHMKLAVGLLINVGGMLAVAQNLLA